MEEENNEPKKTAESKYSSALQLLFYEGEISWQMNVLFIGLNVGIGTIIGNSLDDIEKHRYLLSIFSIFGFLINIAWLGTFRRNNRYYHFRMAQARNAEPKEWKLLRKNGYKFSKGVEILIKEKGIEKNDQKHKLTSFEKRASNKFAIELSIWLFILGFLIIFGLSIFYLFKLICK